MVICFMGIFNYHYQVALPRVAKHALARLERREGLVGVEGLKGALQPRQEEDAHYCQKDHDTQHDEEGVAESRPLLLLLQALRLAPRARGGAAAARAAAAAARAAAARAAAALAVVP